MMKIEEIKYNEIRKVKEEPGLYAWYMDYNVEMQSDSYQNFFISKLFDLKITGNLGETYEGKISQIKSNENIQSNFNKDLFKIATELINIPIYIGISKNLYKRLSKHRDLLEGYSNDEVDQPHLMNQDKINSDNIDENKIDTNEESKYFAQRLGRQLEKLNLSKKHLRVKIIYCDTSITKAQLLNTEFLLNRTYYPILGRN